MKVWPFDRYVHRSNGLYISPADIEEGMKPLREIRSQRLVTTAISNLPQEESPRSIRSTLSTISTALSCEELD